MDSAQGPLHVAIGVLAGVTGGPATYGRRLVESLGELVATDGIPLRMTVLTDRPALFAATRAELVELPMRGGLDRLRWQHVALPRAIARIAPDVYHDTKNALPRGLRVPGVVTVHDLAYHVVPETFGFWSRLFLARATADAVRRARVVIVPSQATARDVERWYPHARQKLAVVLHGITPPRELDAAAVQVTRARWGLPERYVLHVGTLQARKNVDLVVRAVRGLRASHPDLRVVIVGRRGWLAERAIAEIERDDTAKWLGVVDDDELAAIYRAATCFVSPSAYEGFGFTVADALASGVPTVIADVSSLPELCGDAALRLTALDVAAIEAAIRRVLDEHDLAMRLRRAGPERAAELTWRNAALGHLAAYRRARSTAHA